MRAPDDGGPSRLVAGRAIIYLEPPLPLILGRNARRERPVPERVIRELAAQCEPPTPTEAHGLSIASQGAIAAERRESPASGART
jgi:predicted kinase